MLVPDGWLIEAGVDEVGRGPLLGPVVCAAVILHPDRPMPGLTDSKKLSPARRQAWAERIRREAWAYALGEAQVEEIDRLNILQATLLAMQRAVQALPLQPQQVWVDGLHCPRLSMKVSAVVGGDASVPAISAASILAKVSRDAQMEVLDQRFPGYGIARHKGYPTREHLEALQRLGPTCEHRRSFAPVARLLGMST